jgi:hypothetical protein
VYLPLPEAYRSLSRPSSPVSTKAFTLCPLKLDSILSKSACRGTLVVQRPRHPAKLAVNIDTCVSIIRNRVFPRTAQVDGS